MSTIAPGALSAASERLLSLNQYGNDDSVRYRLQEGRHVDRQDPGAPARRLGARRRDLLRAAVAADAARRAEDFAHNGYLWLAWKLGHPGGAAPVRGDRLGGRGAAAAHASTRSTARVRLGAQAALLVMLVVISITFPSFSALNITAVGGVLLAICLGMPGPRGGRAATTAP